MQTEKILVGIGNKARQGKDTLANMLLEFLPDSKIFHWSSALKEECENTDMKFPLISKRHDKYLVYVKNDNLYTCHAYDIGKDPLLDEIYANRKENDIWKVEGREPLIWQFWGTNLRRNTYDNDYWVKRTIDEINKVEEKIILIPDTRFKNEFFAVKNNGGIYIEVIRMNEDGTRFYANDRDPNHPSERDLDILERPTMAVDAKVDYRVVSKSGDMKILKDKAKFIAKEIKRLY